MRHQFPTLQLHTAILATLTSQVAGHGYINEPPSRAGAFLEGGGLCEYGACLWFNQGCTIGCPKCGGVASGFNGCGKDQGNATLPQSARTYHTWAPECGIYPWCAPGSAPIMNPCGVAGGDKHQGTPGNGGDAPPGYKLGDNGTDMRQGAKGLLRTWKVGAVVDVAWAVIANHGGGYQYRLCPKGSEQTEACFQNMPLEFVGNESFIQFCNLSETAAANTSAGFMRNSTPESFPPQKLFPKPCSKKQRTAIPAVRVSTGTLPEGSTWTRNPIPACAGILGGAYNVGCHVSTIPGKYPAPKASQFQFPPAGPDQMRPGLLLGGFGEGACFGCNQKLNPKDCNEFGKAGRNNCTIDETKAQIFQFSVVDKVRVPNVKPGEYTVSFRWDCEQTPQIWSSCSDVTIVAEDHDDLVV